MLKLVCDMQFLLSFYPMGPSFGLKHNFLGFSKAGRIHPCYWAPSLPNESINLGSFILEPDSVPYLLGIAWLTLGTHIGLPTLLTFVRHYWSFLFFIICWATVRSMVFHLAFIPVIVVCHSLSTRGIWSYTDQLPPFNLEHIINCSTEFNMI